MNFVVATAIKMKMTPEKLLMQPSMALAMGLSASHGSISMVSKQYCKPIPPFISSLCIWNLIDTVIAGNIT
jgi:hypothetical protein